MSLLPRKLVSVAFVSSVILAGPALAAQESGGHATASSSNPSGPNAHWSYSGSQGPANWGELSTAYELCKTGKQQSPVDISHPQQAGLAVIKTDYRAVPLHVVNNGHTIQVNYPDGSTMSVGNSKYQLLQLHFHSPSENTAKGSAYPMEIHYVHKDEDGRLGVLAVFMKEGNKNVGLQEIWAYMPKSGGSEFKSNDVVINGHDLLPQNRDYFRFVGSLTTPPCSEGVQWHVMREPVEASRSQIDAFLKVIGENARPVQPIGNRLLIDSAYGKGGSSH